MTDEAALKAAIWDSPADDLPRVVYADYLDEHATVTQQCGCYLDQPGWAFVGSRLRRCPDCRGEARIQGNGFAARAELIRVQCELARWKGKDHDHCPVCGKHWRWRVGVGYSEWIDCENDHRWCSMTHIDLRKRESALLATNAERWAVPILHAIWPGTSHTQAGAEFTSAPGGRVNGSIRFARGFLDRVNLTLADLTDTVAAALGAAGPLAGGVELRDRTPWVQAVEPQWSGWWENSIHSGPDAIPPVLMDLLADDPRRNDQSVGIRHQHRPGYPGVGGCVLFNSPAVATAALDTAAASFCRLAAGYPALPHSERIGAR